MGVLTEKLETREVPDCGIVAELSASELLKPASDRIIIAM